MLLKTPSTQSRRERERQETLNWLTGNFTLKPFTTPLITRADVIAADKLSKRRRAGKRASIPMI